MAAAVAAAVAYAFASASAITGRAVGRLGDIAIFAGVVDVERRVTLPIAAAECLGGCAAEANQRRRDGNGEHYSTHKSTLATVCDLASLWVDKTLMAQRLLARLRNRFALARHHR